MRHRLHLVLPLALVLAAGACADDPGSALLSPDDAAHARGGQSAAPEPVRMLTRNLYLGADIDAVLADPIGGAAAAWAEVQHTNYPVRAGLLADEIAALRPHLIGLQEVTRYTVFAADFTPIQELDFLDVLLLHLGARGLEYEVVTRATNLSVFLPLGDIFIQYTDGGAILKAPGVEVHEAGWRHFASQVVLPAPVNEPNLRSFHWADVTVDAQRFLFVNTHLEIQRWADEQVGQTAELLEFVDAWGGPVFMVGDFNSAANPGARPESRTPTYRMVLDAGFDDLWLRGHGRFTNAGLTCCHASDLSNPEPELDQRIDYIFGRNVPSGKGYAGGAELQVVGDESGDRFCLAPDYCLWPSDHAGVFGEVWMPRGLMARR